MKKPIFDHSHKFMLPTVRIKLSKTSQKSDTSPIYQHVYFFFLFLLLLMLSWVMCFSSIHKRQCCQFKVINSDIKKVSCTLILLLLRPPLLPTKRCLPPGWCSADDNQVEQRAGRAPGFHQWNGWHCGWSESLWLLHPARRIIKQIEKHFRKAAYKSVQQKTN